MNHRFDIPNLNKSDKIDQLLDIIKYEIRQVQEEQYYKAVEHITENQRNTLVQSLKKFQKDYLGPIKITHELFDKGVVRVEYNFSIGVEQVVKVVLHGSERGVVYITSCDGYEDAAKKVEQRYKKK